MSKCLEVLGVTMEFELRYPNGQTHSSRENHDLLLEKMELLEKELEVEKKAAEFQKKSLRNLRTDLSSAIGYAELGEREGVEAEQYLEKIQTVLSNMKSTIAYALGEEVDDEIQKKMPN